jgi:hypothetical protein
MQTKPISIDPHANTVFAGEVQLLRWSEASNSGRTIVLQLPEDLGEHPFKRFNVRDRNTKTPGKRFMVAFVEIGDDELPVAQEAPAKPAPKMGSGKPYGKRVAVLYRTGWMLNPRVMAAAGSKEDFHDSLLDRPCIMSGRIDPDAMELMAPRNDSTGYYAVPVMPDQMEAAKQVDEHKFHRKCIEILQEWASQSIAGQIGYATLGHVPPAKLAEWAKARGLDSTIPPQYFIEER